MAAFFFLFTHWNKVKYGYNMIPPAIITPSASHGPNAVDAVFGTLSIGVIIAIAVTEWLTIRIKQILGLRLQDLQVFLILEEFQLFGSLRKRMLL